MMEPQKILLVGLDFETTGLNLRDLRPLQIGVYAHDPRVQYAEYVRWPHYPLVLESNAAAQAAADIHKIDPQKIVEGKHYIEIDDELHGILAPLTKEYVLVATGFGVGTFDLQILRKWFPRTAALFSHRVVDPNTVALMGVVTQPELKKLKDLFNKIGTQEMERHGWERVEHDALSDAVHAIFTVEAINDALDQATA